MQIETAIPIVLNYYDTPFFKITMANVAIFGERKVFILHIL